MKEELEKDLLEVDEDRVDNENNSGTEDNLSVENSLDTEEDLDSENALSTEDGLSLEYAASEDDTDDEANKKRFELTTKRKIEFAVISAFLIAVIVFLSVLFFTNKNPDNKYLGITEEGAVYLAPEYVDIGYYLQEERYSETTKNQIICQAEEAGLYPEEYVFVAVLAHGDYDYLFKDVKSLKETIIDIEKRHQMPIRDLYKVMKSENPFIDFLIRCKFSEAKKMDTVDVLTIPNKINNVKVTSVAPYAFFNCSSIKEIVFPKDVVTVGVSAFENSNLTKVTFKADKIDIQYSSIRNCTSLERILCGSDEHDILPTIEVNESV